MWLLSINKLQYAPALDPACELAAMDGAGVVHTVTGAVGAAKLLSSLYTGGAGALTFLLEPGFCFFPV